jgi:hypothetical protein
VFAAWREVAQAMASSSAGSDREMAIGITDFVRAMPVQQDGPLVVDRRQQKEPARTQRIPPERDRQLDDHGPDIDL